MALRHESLNTGNRRHTRASRKEAAFRTHLAAYLCVGLFLLSLNLLTSPFDLWFYWPLFFWGWGLAFHALATYGADAPSRVPLVLRSLAPWLGNHDPAPRPDVPARTPPAPFAAEAFAALHERIERINELAWRIADADLRGQVLDFSAAAENTVASMARDRAAAADVRRFDADILAPVASALARYAEMEAHNAPGSREAARRLADCDLTPLLGRRVPAAGALETPPSLAAPTR